MCSGEMLFINFEDIPLIELVKDTNTINLTPIKPSVSYAVTRIRKTGNVPDTKFKVYRFT